jgi:hypothetical protein
MITIFSDFSIFSVEKIAVFLENQCKRHFFAQTSSILNQNRHFFAEFLGENIFKIITSVPGRFS